MEGSALNGCLEKLQHKGDSSAADIADSLLGFITI